MDEAIEQRIEKYWTSRSHDFGEVRKNELGNGLGDRWGAEITRLLPIGSGLKILDVGTGTGFFSILLAKLGHDLIGVDLTPAMIEEAKTQAAAEGCAASFMVMNAQKLDFADETFDAVVSRNLTWTLPDPEAAYREWYRVLKKGGTLINFDANYGHGILSGMNKTIIPGRVPYGHTGVTPELAKENSEITLSMEISRQDRPAWDNQMLKEIGFSYCTCDVHAGAVLLRELNDQASPMFLVLAKK